jgi:PPOX class probable F420-dependent enzyme
VPVCFAIDGDRVTSAVDHKPKSTRALARLDDIARTRRATLLVDHYDDDRWSQLWWVRVTGTAAVHEPGSPVAVRGVARLVEKYRQYRDQPPTGAVYTVALDQVTWWRADAESDRA